MPSIHNVQKRLEDSGFTVLMIALKESAGIVEQTVRERGYTLPVLLDIYGSVAQSYGIWAPPSAVLIDREGNLVARAIGPRPWESSLGVKLLRSLTE